VGESYRIEQEKMKTNSKGMNEKEMKQAQHRQIIYKDLNHGKEKRWEATNRMEEI